MKATLRASRSSLAMSRVALAFRAAHSAFASLGRSLSPRLRSQDAAREPVPIASDGERPMSDARRTLPGSPEG
jgi:hypothetical protein